MRSGKVVVFDFDCVLSTEDPPHAQRTIKHPVPSVRSVFDYCLRRGHRIAIATNARYSFERVCSALVGVTSAGTGRSVLLDMYGSEEAFRPWYVRFQDTQNGSKADKIRLIQRRHALQLSDMLFFDDMLTNVEDVLNIGVLGIKVPAAGPKFMKVSCAGISMRCFSHGVKLLESSLRHDHKLGVARAYNARPIYPSHRPLGRCGVLPWFRDERGRAFVVLALRDNAMTDFSVDDLGAPPPMAQQVPDLLILDEANNDKYMTRDAAHAWVRQNLQKGTYFNSKHKALAAAALMRKVLPSASTFLANKLFRDTEYHFIDGTYVIDVTGHVHPGLLRTLFVQDGDRVVAVACAIDDVPDLAGTLGGSSATLTRLAGCFTLVLTLGLTPHNRMP